MRKRIIGAAIGVCLSVSAFSALVRAKNPGDIQDASRRSIRELDRQRLEISRTVYKHQVDRQMANAEVVIRNFDDMSIWSKHWMEDEMRLDPSVEDRIAAVRSHLDRMKTVEERMMNWVKVGQIRESDALKANYYRLEAESMLLEAERSGRGR